ncbi:hypothetical protein CDAR_382311 [Caerostris darwini]|uniref:Uncharacterized protein n=1 Tax=Caerostris darwini TaxID=1538125 RepID=A0AAV4VZY6_9ARAC|nr:hypothetical protein CDAR_382311 [Caerostris darwini]
MHVAFLLLMEIDDQLYQGLLCDQEGHPLQKEIRNCSLSKGSIAQGCSVICEIKWSDANGGGLKNSNILSFLLVILTPIRRDVFDTFLSRFPKGQENRMTEEWDKTKCLLNPVGSGKKMAVKKS